MMRTYKRADPSTRYIPSGARKVADLASDAIAYLYEHPGKSRDGSARVIPYAIAYSGKRAKHDFHERYMSEASRERRIRDYFEGRRATLARKAERKNKPRGLQVGNILRTCWGYDQTNVEFFQVTALIGNTMVELRELKQSSKVTGWCHEDVAPLPDEFCGEPIRRKVSGYDGTSCRIDDVRTAWLHGTGVAHATSYA